MRIINPFKVFYKWWTKGEPCEHIISERLKLIENDISLLKHSYIYHENDTANGKLPRNDFYHVCRICKKRCKEFVLRMEIMRCYRIDWKK